MNNDTYYTEEKMTIKVPKAQFDKLIQNGFMGTSVTTVDWDNNMIMFIFINQNDYTRQTLIFKVNE